MKKSYPNMTFAEIGRTLGQEWSSLTDADKYVSFCDLKGIAGVD